MSYLCFQIKEVPDLSLNKYQSIADTGIDGVLSRHESFLRQWHGICGECRTTLHLLYCFLPSEPIGKRLKVYFILQGENSNLQILKPLIFNSPLSDFYNFEESDLPTITFESGVTLTKNERIANIYNPLTAKEKNVHYVPHWELNEKARLYDMFKMMKTVGTSYSGTPCAYRIDLYPTSIVDKTRQFFTPIIKDLKGDNDIQLLKETPNKNSDGYAGNVCKEFEDWLSKIETTPHFRANIYAFSNNNFLSKVILNAASSEAISEGDVILTPIKPDSTGRFDVISRMGETSRDYCLYAQKATLTEWTTTFSLDEVGPFFKLPVLYDGEQIEIPKETAPIQHEDGIHLGYDEKGYPVKFPLDKLPRHAFFTGMPGSGKTNTMLHLATELNKRNIPFLVLEPAKKEYRELLCMESMKDIFLFSPHLSSCFPLRINPFEFPKGVRLSEHINALLEVFQGSFMLEGPTYTFLSRSIQKAYESLGWDIEDINDFDEPEYPTLKDIYVNLESEINKSTYDSEIKGNVQSFLQVRLGGLMERDAGEIFNTRYSTLPPEKWLTSSAIVELEVLSEQAKNFLILLLCHYIFETLKVDPQGGIDPATNKKMPVRHTIFIEEAHNIIASSSEQESSDSVDPKVSATKYIVKMLAEVRALREAIIIADQLPTALTDEVTKNTGFKLVHRLTSKDDREVICSAVSASPLQFEQIASFTKGKALIHYEGTLKPYSLQIDEWKKPKIDYNFANDKELYLEICNRKAVLSELYSAFDSWCDNIYEFQDTVSDKLGFTKKGLDDRVQFAEEKMEAILKIEALLKKIERMRNLWRLDLDIPGFADITEGLDYMNQALVSFKETIVPMEFKSLYE